MSEYMQNKQLLRSSRANTKNKPLFLQIFLPYALLLVLGVSLWFFAGEKEPLYSGLLAGMDLAGLLFLGFSLKTVQPWVSSIRPETPEQKGKGQQELEKIIQSTPYPLLITDSSGYCLIFNKWFAELFGLAQEQEKVFLLDGQKVNITASLGLVKYNLHYSRAEDMLRDAKIAMHQAKKQGKNRWVFFSSEMYQRKSRRTLLEKDLRLAMERQELIINYQPLLRLENEELNALEALIRWEYPEHGLVSPGKFIPLAEETGLIEPIGDWVLQESCRQIKTWSKYGNSLTLNVNISGKQLEKAGLEQKIYQLLQDNNLDPACLNLEVTESMAMARLESNVRTLKRLKYMGIRLSIDDFGTGYSSLAHLQRFPLDELKIDRSVINNLQSGQNDQHIVQAIVELASGLKLEMVAEGIETQSQLEMVKGFKCHYGQGFLFSRALEPAVIEKTWFAKDKLLKADAIYQPAQT